MSQLIVGMVESEEVQGPCISQRKSEAKQFVLSRCTSQTRPPLLECSLQLLSAALFSGKAHWPHCRDRCLAL